MYYDLKSMLKNGEMAKIVGVNPKTLRKWAKKKCITSYQNPINRYYYYDKQLVLKELKLIQVSMNQSIDEN